MMMRIGILMFVLLVLCGRYPLCAQPVIERKIIIEDGQYYFCTVDEETQLATLHSGVVTENLNKARRYTIPIGRERNDAFNPLCFDISNNTLIGINWILNSNNSRYEAIKKLELKDWKKVHPAWTNEEWAQLSFDQPVLAPNVPWQEMLATNNVLENCFFDLIQVESKIMAICNQGRLRIWSFAGGAWTPLSVSIPVDFSTYFSLVSVHGAVIAVVDGTGSVYRLDEAAGTLTQVKSGKAIKPQILIVDNDHYKTYTIPEETIQAAGFLSVKELITLSEEITF
ncbi:MAG TPA: hypothetical protein VL092_02670 [Chitinophagaceae bacterium]|nr:hypothetical protein [Chitinophagaceae bacterium]